MMQENTSLQKKKIAPIVCAVVVILFMSLILAFFVFPLVKASWGIKIASVFLGVYALFIGAGIVGCIIALIQRMREIDSGEEEEAKKY